MSQYSLPEIARRVLLERNNQAKFWIRTLIFHTVVKNFHKNEIVIHITNKRFYQFDRSAEKHFDENPRFILFLSEYCRKLGIKLSLLSRDDKTLLVELPSYAMIDIFNQLKHYEPKEFESEPDFSPSLTMSPDGFLHSIIEARNKKSAKFLDRMEQYFLQDLGKNFLEKEPTEDTIVKFTVESDKYDGEVLDFLTELTAKHFTKMGLRSIIDESSEYYDILITIPPK